MRKQFKNKAGIHLFFLLLLLCNSALFSQPKNETKIKVALIYKFSELIVWNNQEEIDTFRILALTYNKKIVKEFNALAAMKKWKKRPIKFKQIYNLRELANTQMVYLDNDRCHELNAVFQRLKNQKTLLVSDSCHSKKNVMINLLPVYENGKVHIHFKVNRRNIEQRGLTILPQLLLIGGSEIDVREMYKEQEKELELEKQRLKDKLAELEKQKEQIRIQNMLLHKQKQEIAKQEKKIANFKQQIDKQEKRLDDLLDSVQKKEQLLQRKSAILNSQEQQIQFQKKEIFEQQDKLLKQMDDVKEQEAILQQQTDAIDKQENKIAEQKEILKRQMSQLQMQRSILYLIFAVLLLVLSLGFFVYRGYKIKKIANQKLEEKNYAINQQKEEITSQAEQLEYTNRELEKLSIVASETDNAVIIMDARGDFEWINSGFTRLYGYTLDEFINEYGINITDASTNPEIERVIQHCVELKESMIYESSTKSKEGETIWTQTTLTPITDAYNNIVKLVAIDSDIRKLKRVENQLREEKRKTDKQNDYIRGSIRYAQTIQKAILPPKSEIDQTFDTFIMYLPKDIVSGDFYWHFCTSDPETHTERIFLAAVDCTGHGVPGAFMSMIGNRLLNEIIREKNIYDPALILEKLNTGIYNSLHQDVTSNSDGMDVCLCRFERLPDNEYRMVFSGAKRSLYYYRQGATKIEILKGHALAIGGMGIKKNLGFSNHQIKLKSGDLLYLTSDGYIDQNNPERKRFGTKRFLEIILKNIDLPLDEQQYQLEIELAKYQKDCIQRDDITILGVKLK